MYPITNPGSSVPLNKVWVRFPPVSNPFPLINASGGFQGAGLTSLTAIRGVRPSRNQDQEIHNTQFYKHSRLRLHIPHTLELVEPVELTEHHLELLVPTKDFLYPCKYHATSLREVGLIKPLDELAQLSDDRNDLIMGSRVE